MSEIHKRREVNEVEILNGEKARLTAAISLLVTDLETVEKKHAQTMASLALEEGTKCQNIIRLDKEIETRTTHSNELAKSIVEKSTIESNKLVDIEKRKNELAIREAKSATTHSENENRSSELVQKEKAFTQREKDLNLKENTLTDRENSLKLRESKADDVFLEAREAKKIGEKAAKEYLDKLASLESREKMLLAKETSIGEREANITALEEKADIALYQGTTLKKEYEQKSNDLEEKQEQLVRDTGDLAKRVTLNANREADLLIREREVKLREKTVGIMEREKALVE